MNCPVPVPVWTTLNPACCRKWMQAVVVEAGSTLTVPESMKKDGRPVLPVATCHSVMSKWVAHWVDIGSR